MSIKNLMIQNFQSHKRTEIELHPGVNAFIGKSDCGKSAIIRSLIWIITNKPSGSSYRSNWGGVTDAALGIDDGIVILRSRADSDNAYTLSMGANHEEQFRAFKSGVPEEIEKILDIDPISIQGQHDSSFLLSETSSSEVARTFNRVANLSKIDDAISSIKKATSKSASKVVFLNEQLEENTKQLESFSQLEEMEQLVEAYETIQERLKQAHSAVLSLKFSLNRAKSLQIQIETSNKVIAAQKAIELFSELKTESDSTKKNQTYLLSLIQNIKRLRKEIKEKDALISKSDKMESASVLAHDMMNDCESMKKLNTIITRIWSVQKNIKEFENEIQETENWLAKEFPDKCPLCGRNTK